MAVRAYFYGGPLNGQWKAMQEVVPAFRVAVPSERLDLFAENKKEPLFSKEMTGIYQSQYTWHIGDGVEGAEYVWRGYEMREVQEGERIE